ncbi:MAG: hypothetical protein C0625_13320 [Arcobacter sp.]|nr:MAG: hypothetical protein C0625_13320 [Arcobacter sp.]
MKESSQCKNMNDIREAIDIIDEDIVKLIAKRSLYVKEASKFKKDEEAVKDKERVEKVIKSKKNLAKRVNASPELVESIYRTMIDYFIKEEMKEWKKKQQF